MKQKFTKEQKADFIKRILDYERQQLEKVKQKKKNDAGN